MKRTSQDARKRNKNNAPVSKQKTNKKKMANNSNDQALRLLRTAFQDTDREGRGEIDANDLRALFTRAGLNPSDAEIAEMVRQIDKNFDHKLSFDEIVDGLHKHPHLQSVLSLRGQFLLVDRKGTGFITVDDHISAIKSMGNPWAFSEDQMRQVFKSMDTKNEGKVFFEDLIKTYAVKPTNQSNNQ